MSYVAVGVAAFDVYQGAQNSSIQELQAENAKQMSDINAKYADIDAWNAETYGYTEAAAYQAKINQTVGAQRTALAAHNVDVNFGTAAEVQNESKLNGYLNQLDMIQAGQRKAANYTQQANNIRMQGAMGFQTGEFKASQDMNQGISSGIQAGISGYSIYSKNKPKPGADGGGSDDFSLDD